jgi:hypothetical protein
VLLVSLALGQGCPSIPTYTTPNTFVYRPRCNHNTLDMTQAMTRLPETQLVTLVGKLRQTNLGTSVSKINACFGSCSLYATPRVGSDAATLRECNVKSYGEPSSNNSRFTLLAREVANEIDQHFSVMHATPTVSQGNYELNQLQHQCFFANESRTITFASRFTSLQIIVTSAIHPAGDHWNSVPMWAIPCAWEAITGRPLVIRLNVHRIATQMTDDELRRDFGHHILHAMGLDGAHYNTTTPYITRDVATLGSSGSSRTVTYARHAGLQAYVTSTWNCSGNDGVPMDDELRLKLFYTPSVSSLYRDEEIANGPSRGTCKGPCPTAPSTTTILDTTRFSHVESRVFGTDEWSAGVWGSTLGKVTVEGLLATNWYTLRTDLVPGPDRSAAEVSGAGCSGFTARCNSEAMRKTDLFLRAAGPALQQHHRVLGRLQAHQAVRGGGAVLLVLRHERAKCHGLLQRYEARRSERRRRLLPAVYQRCGDPVHNYWRDVPLFRLAVWNRDTGPAVQRRFKLSEGALPVRTNGRVLARWD